MQPIDNTKIEPLNSTNYSGWSKKATLYLQKNGYLRFIEYESYEAWYNAKVEKEDQQIRYENRIAAIRNNADLNDQQKQTEIDKVDTLFHNDLGRWSANKAKTKESWNKEEEMVRAIILTLVTDNLKMKVKKGTPDEVITAYSMWNNLKNEIGTPSVNLLLLFKLVFYIKYNSSEKLSSLLSRYENNLEKLIEACEAFKSIPQIFHVYLILGSLPPG
jgi:hypothetical protein